MKLLSHTVWDAILALWKWNEIIYFSTFFIQVCLDNTATTEKELDTVEVLKAIQKAKEAKNKLNNTDKKV